MASDVEQADDYEYDLAHEMKTIKLPSQRHAFPIKNIRGVPHNPNPDADGDYEYDQIHEG